MKATLKEVKALVFDVFGTVVDWRASIIAEGKALGRKKRLDIDWEAFADAWRAGYAPAMDKVRRGELPWASIDVLHRMILGELLAKFKIATLSEDEKAEFNRVWHRLKPWPDAVKGLSRLKKRYTIATLSNGNMALLVNMAKHAGLRTAFVQRPKEFGDPAKKDLTPEKRFDLNVKDFGGLAAKLGCA